ncbi:MAG: O-antigen ligase family protein [Candidatus Rokubacteria bacterium]|nr:O-antigen ligase family protein [Candidatus Rokubacteria bacterium]
MTGSAPAAAHAVRAPVSPQTGGEFAFRCLMFFTFVLLVTPQAIVPQLGELRLAWVSGALAIVSYRGNRGPRQPITIVTPEIRLVLWLVALAVLSVPLSTWPGGSLAHVLDKYSKSVIIFLLLANTLTTPSRLGRILRLMIGCSVVISITGIYAFLSGQFLEGTTRIVGYTSGLTMNPNDFALTLNLLLPLALGLFLWSRSVVARIVLLPTMLLMLFGIMVSFSRAGFLDLAAMALVATARLVKRAGVGAMFAVAAVAGVVFAIAPAGYASRIYAIFDASADLSGSSTARWEGMQNAFLLMFQHPLLGVGVGMNEVALAEGGFGWSPVHDMYLQVGSELGVAGFVVFVLLCWKVVTGLRRALRELAGIPEARALVGLGLGIELSLYGFLVGGIFAPVAYNFYLYYVAGFAVAFQRIARRVVAATAASV